MMKNPSNDFSHYVPSVGKAAMIIIEISHNGKSLPHHWVDNFLVCFAHDKEKKVKIMEQTKTTQTNQDRYFYNTRYLTDYEVKEGDFKNGLFISYSIPYIIYGKLQFSVYYQIELHQKFKWLYMSSVTLLGDINGELDQLRNDYNDLRFQNGLNPISTGTFLLEK